MLSEMGQISLTLPLRYSCQFQGSKSQQ